MRALDLWIVGGDKRMVYLAGELAADGHKVHTWGLGLPGEAPGPQGLGGADAVILPLPALRVGEINAPLAEAPPELADLLDALAPGQYLLGGKLPPALVRQAGERGAVIADYLDREELAIRNAVATSEGAVQLAMETLPVTLHGSKVLVLGAGRIGTALCRQLSGLGARVTLAARRDSDLCRGEVFGWDTARSDMLGDCPLEEFDLLCNTVPALLLDRAALSRLKPGAAVIDLASHPGGTDFAAAKELGVTALFAPGLPGKAAPLTAARAIKATLYNLLTELGACL